MTIHRGFAAAFALAFLLLIVLVARLSSAPKISRENAYDPARALTEPIDQLDVFLADRFAAGAFDHAVLVDGRLALAGEKTDVFPRTGRWDGAVVKTEFPFLELLPSWNPLCPPDTGVTLHARVRMQHSGEWSPWLYFGQWGRTRHRTDRVTDFADGVVETDILELKRPADAYQLRVGFESFTFDPATVPTVRKLAAVASGDRPLRSPIERAGQDATDLPASVDLPVPFRAQGDSNPALAGEICSPTSVAMVMSYRGIDVPTIENALAIYDVEYDLFGNWNRAVAQAGSLGLDAKLVRVRSVEQARRHLADGQPLIASIRFRKGEFPSNVMSQTAGHLIVIRGYDANGDFIVNDPASRNRGNGVVYKADELARAWIDKGGVTYVIGEMVPAAAGAKR
jgi:hypothetical protein